MTPNARINAEGRATYDLSGLKALASYRMAALGGFIVGAAFRYETGVRWERTVNLAPGVLAPLQFVVIRTQPRGSRSLPAVKNLDVRVQKTVRVQGSRVAVMADVFNVTNQGTPIAVFGASGSSFGRILNRMDPRQLRLAVRVEF